MNNNKLPAFPDTLRACVPSFGNQCPENLPTGFNKLELASLMIAQGLSSACISADLSMKKRRDIAIISVMLAKAVLEEVNK